MEHKSNMRLTKEQKDARVGYIGSGHAAAIMGHNPYASAWDAWAQITGKLPPLKPTAPMQAGLILESAIIDWLELESGIVVQRAVDCFDGDDLHVGPEYCGAHLDGLFYVGDSPIVVEAKSAGIYNFLDREVWGDANTDQIPVHYLIQTHHQMIISGASETVVPALIPPIGFRRYQVARTESLVEQMLERYDWFWTKCVLADVPPEHSLPAIGTVKAMIRVPDFSTVVDRELVENYDLAAQEAKDAASKKESAQAELLAALGTAEGASFEGGYLTYKADKRGARRLYIKREDF